MISENMFLQNIQFDLLTNKRTEYFSHCIYVWSQKYLLFLHNNTLLFTYLLKVKI